VVREVGEV